jgi:hypothetical protein
MRADLVEHGKLPLKRSKNGRYTGIARCGRSQIFHGQIPITRVPCLPSPQALCGAAETG